jgi:hypothetical protein
VTPGQKKRLEADRRAAKSAKSRAKYDARRIEEARQAGIKARTAEEARIALEAREAERAQLRAEREQLRREQDRIDAAESAKRWEKWRAEQDARDAANRLAAQDLADARKSEAANGPERAYCRMYVSADGGSDQPETPGAARCWLLPGHQGRCQAALPKPARVGGRGLGLLLMAAALWSS